MHRIRLRDCADMKDFHDLRTPGLKRFKEERICMNDNALEQYIYVAECMTGMLKDLGFSLKKGMRILDFGCGEGEMVRAFTSLGYDAYGIDIIDCPSLDPAHFRKIGFDPYVLPYEDDYFDFIFSSSVFEHVQNTEEALREIYRVLKPSGATLHSFPSPYRFLEAHIFVPFGGVLQSDAWLKLWAFLGVRNPFQKGLPWKEVYERNKGYCRDGINYYRYREFRQIVLSVFGNIKVVTKAYFNNMPGGAARIGRKFPIPAYGKLFFFFREWVLFIRKK